MAAINPFRSTLFERRRQAAGRYAAANKSDPHAFKVAMRHMNNGLGDLYDADTYPQKHQVDERWAPLQQWQEQRKLHVTKDVNGTQYKNVCRA